MSPEDREKLLAPYQQWVSKEARAIETECKFRRILRLADQARRVHAASDSKRRG